MDTAHRNPVEGEPDRDPSHGLDHTQPPKLAGAVRLGKRTYAASLIWNSAGDQSSLLAEARESAMRLAASVMCLYRLDADTLPQYGLGDALMDHKPGMPVLAVAVAAASVGSLYGVWHTDDGAWVLLGIRGDASIAYDKAFENEAQARVEFYEGLTTEPWSEIVCPEAWQIEGTRPAGSLSERFGRAPVRLRSVRRNLPRIAFFAMLTAVALSAGGYFYKQAHKPLPPMPRVPNIVHVPPMPWVGRPLPSAVLQACVGSLWGAGAAAAGIPGWSAGSVGSCDGETVRYTIVRGDGTQNWVVPFLRQTPGSPTLSNMQDKMATLTWKLPPLPTYPVGSPGIVLSKAQDYLRSNFAELQLPLSITPGQNMPFWHSFRYAFSTDVSPDTFAPLLGKIPGSIISDISYDTTSGKWNVTGEVFQHMASSPGRG